MNIADWVIVSTLVLSCVISLWRGFVKEALSLVVWVAAFFVAMTFGDRMNAFLVDSISTPSLRQMASFGLLFVITLVIGTLINHLVAAVVRMTGLSGTDRLLGTVFGAARGVILVLAILILAPPILGIDQDSWWKQSLLIPKFLMLEDWAREMGSMVFGWLTSIFGTSSA
ncbi:membrane protein required for colicin V production [Sinobacterium caligoides]|uniref:Membrane protein required for colicin V production n=1 Tax=Sinobacterium caligoides TaxID=933926 RepID=A0A3N2DJW9_9GAMM|nr:CvpA family protein [Sinobacterium caligoides]ROR99961.1 membrane protein required for colicin V production [Sinobacterium caligoides]